MISGSFALNLSQFFWVLPQFLWVLSQLLTNLVTNQSSMPFSFQIVVLSCELLPTWFGFLAPWIPPPWTSVGAVLWVSVAAKVQFAPFCRIMGALFRASGLSILIFCSSLRFVSSSSYLSGVGSLAMVVWLFWWRRLVLISQSRVFDLGNVMSSLLGLIFLFYFCNELHSYFSVVDCFQACLTFYWCVLFLMKLVGGQNIYISICDGPSWRLMLG